MDDFRNQLYYGDNLDVLRKHIADSSVDLIYLDPPFNSKADYNILYKEVDGTPSEAQFHAFTDYWRWDTAAIKAYRDLLASDRAPEELKRLIEGFEQFLGHNAMLAYLVMMAPRLVELRRVLKPTGSIYLHCDPTAGHYLKILMDAVFGVKSFRNEIIWRRTGSHNSAKRYGPNHDIILFYTKSEEYTWKRIYRPYMQGHVDTYFKKKDERGRYWSNALTGKGTRKGESGQPWRKYDPTAKGRHWAIPGIIAQELGIEDLPLIEKLEIMYQEGYINLPKGKAGMPEYRQYLHQSKGMLLQDLWTYQPHTKGVLFDSGECIDEDVRWIGKRGDPERLGYEPQKPVGILKRILKASSNEGDVVLDPFCGCGTTIAAAQALNRKWIGIDITYLAINLIRNRLADHFADEVAYEVHGDPKDWESARELAQKTDVPRKEFELWALSLVEAQPKGDPYKKGGPDQGVDGIIRFEDGKKLGKLKSKRVIIQVKSDKNPGVPFVRDLRGTMENEKAVMGVLILLYEPGKRSTIYTVAADAGLYNCEIMGGKDYPKIQVLTIRGLLEETEFLKMPITRRPIQRAERIQKDKQKKLEV